MASNSGDDIPIASMKEILYGNHQCPSDLGDRPEKFTLRQIASFARDGCNVCTIQYEAIVRCAPKSILEDQDMLVEKRHSNFETMLMFCGGDKPWKHRVLEFFVVDCKCQIEISSGKVIKLCISPLLPFRISCRDPNE